MTVNDPAHDDGSGRESLTFRDVLAEALAEDAGESSPLAVVLRFPDANAVIATDEMQAIRRALYRMADGLRSTVDLDEIPWLLGDVYKLPPHVIDWVLGGDQ